jgi:hypothetical protein
MVQTAAGKRQQDQRGQRKQHQSFHDIFSCILILYSNIIANTIKKASDDQQMKGALHSHDSRPISNTIPRTPIQLDGGFFWYCAIVIRFP